MEVRVVTISDIIGPALYWACVLYVLSLSHTNALALSLTHSLFLLFLLFHLRLALFFLELCKKLIRTLTHRSNCDLIFSFFFHFLHITLLYANNSSRREIILYLSHLPGILLNWRTPNGYTPLSALVSSSSLSLSLPSLFE